MSQGIPCPICGHEDGNCTGGRKEIFTPSGIVTQTGPARLPRKNVPIGKAGYVGNVQLYDPKYPDINLVNPDAEDPPKPIKRKRVKSDSNTRPT